MPMAPLRDALVHPAKVTLRPPSARSRPVACYPVVTRPFGAGTPRARFKKRGRAACACQVHYSQCTPTEEGASLVCCHVGPQPLRLGPL